MINTDGVEIVFSYYEKDAHEIIRCLKTLYTTVEGTQPLDRKFGLSREFLGQPIPVAQNMYRIEVIEKTDIYEPRVKVSEVTFNVNAEEGEIYPVIKLEKGDEDDEYY